MLGAWLTNTHPTHCSLVTPSSWLVTHITISVIEWCVCLLTSQLRSSLSSMKWRLRKMRSAYFYRWIKATKQHVFPYRWIGLIHIQKDEKFKKPGAVCSKTHGCPADAMMRCVRSKRAQGSNSYEWYHERVYEWSLRWVCRRQTIDTFVIDAVSSYWIGRRIDSSN